MRGLVNAAGPVALLVAGRRSETAGVYLSSDVTRPGVGGAVLDPVLATPWRAGPHGGELLATDRACATERLWRKPRRRAGAHKRPGP